MGLANNELIKAGVDLLTKLLETANDLTDDLGGTIGSIAKLGITLAALKAGKNIFNSIKELEKGIVRKIMSETSHDEMYSKPSIAQMQIIKYILKHDGKTIYQRDLEEVFNLRRATISGILKTMEKNNVIIRVCDPNDARGKIVILSDDAKKFFKEKETLFKKIETVLKKDISKEELEIFYKVILKMRDNINRKD